MLRLAKPEKELQRRLYVGRLQRQWVPRGIVSHQASIFVFSELRWALGNFGELCWVRELTKVVLQFAWAQNSNLQFRPDMHTSISIYNHMGVSENRGP